VGPTGPAGADGREVEFRTNNNVLEWRYVGEQTWNQLNLNFGSNVVTSGSSTDFSNWIFNEDKCSFEPPVPYPGDGGPYIWIQAAEIWVRPKIETPAANIQPAPYPLDGKEYEFNSDNNRWVPKL
jgi:hypothetical protein